MTDFAMQQDSVILDSERSRQILKKKKELESCDHPAVQDSIVQPIMNLLNPLEPHKSTRFTLQVVKQTSQGVELLWTAALETMVHLLLMHGRVNMRLQRFSRIEPLFA